MPPTHIVLGLWVIISCAAAVACQPEPTCDGARDVDLTPFYPELGGDAKRAIKSSEAMKRRLAAGLPDDVQAFLAQPCEKSCASFLYHGDYQSESVAGCRSPAPNDAGVFVLHCEIRQSGHCGGSQLKVP